MTSTSRKIILVVDDDRTTRHIMAYMLRAHEYDVLEAGDGDQALALARERSPDGILLDINMPGMGGIEVCRRVRAMEQHRATPVLIVTAMDERDKLQEAFEAGCDDFIGKPLNSIVVHARLRGHLERAEYSHQLERIRRNLNRYISPRTQQMVERYTESGTLPPPRTDDLCILFTDIRDFTELSQHINPNRLFSMLSHHLGVQADLIYEHGGYVDKFAGDGIMAVFEGADGAQRACCSALEIVKAARATHALDTEHLLKVGIGIHQGPAMIGNIGSEGHLDYSVIGATPNLAARLCGHAQPLSIVVSESVYIAVGEECRLRLSEERAVDIKGVPELMTVYTLDPAR